MLKIKVKDLIEHLRKVNPEADFQVIALNCPQEFTFTHGGGDGCTLANCDDFGPYINMLHRGDGIYIRGQGDEREKSTGTFPGPQPVEAMHAVERAQEGLRESMKHVKP